MFTMFFPHSVCVYLLSDWELFGLLSIEWNSDFHTSPWWLQSDGGVWVAVPAASSRGPTRWRLMKKYPLLRLLSNSGQLKYSSFLVLFLSCKEYIIRKLSSLCGNHWTVMPGSLWPHSGWGSVMDSYCSSLVGEQIAVTTGSIWYIPQSLVSISDFIRRLLCDREVFFLLPHISSVFWYAASS